MRSITRRPRAASRRSPDADIEPSGKAMSAAAPRRSGALELTSDGAVRAGRRIEDSFVSDFWFVLMQIAPANLHRLYKCHFCSRQSLLLPTRTPRTRAARRRAGVEFDPRGDTVDRRRRVGRLNSIDLGRVPSGQLG
jgi:hypothetical protein